MFKVYKLNDCDWYMAETLEQAIEAALNDVCDHDDDYVDDPHELSPEAMESHTFNDWETGELVERTFAEELARRVASGPKAEMFATTEF